MQLDGGIFYFVINLSIHSSSTLCTHVLTTVSALYLRKIEAHVYLHPCLHIMTQTLCLGKNNWIFISKSRFVSYRRFFSFCGFFLFKKMSSEIVAGWLVSFFRLFAFTLLRSPSKTHTTDGTREIVRWGSPCIVYTFSNWQHNHRMNYMGLSGDGSLFWVFVTDE